MASSIICVHCSGAVVSDPETYTMVCSSCGIQHSVSDSFVTDFTTSMSSSFVTADLTYLQRRAYHAELVIQDITSRLNLSSRYNETFKLVSLITEHSFGTGDWFNDLVAACAYIVSRQHHLSLSISEASAVVGSDVRSLGRMVLRVMRFLEDSEDIPGFDAVLALERGVREGASFEKVEEEKKEAMISMGRFLIQCMIKWFLMTGRKPMPAVAAVVVLVMEVCEVKTDFENVCKDFYASVNTTTRRLKELKETLIKVAKEVLPWGKDVTVKNLVQNMPVMVRVMEMKSRMKKKKVAEFDFDKHLTMFHNIVDEDEYGSDYFRVRQPEEVNFDELNSSTISAEKLFDAYKNALNRIAEYSRLGALNGAQGKAKRSKKEIEVEEFWDSWEGRFELGKKLSLKQVLERDIGYEALPPSFVKGIESRNMRKVKIRAAKKRIDKLMHPWSNMDLALPEEDENIVNQGSSTSKKRKRNSASGNVLDWEDCIIELLLLHKVHEEEIEQGQYVRLLDLHVFSSTGIYDSKSRESDVK